MGRPADGPRAAVAVEATSGVGLAAPAVAVGVEPMGIAEGVVHRNEVTDVRAVQIRWRRRTHGEYAGWQLPGGGGGGGGVGVQSRSG